MENDVEYKINELLNVLVKDNKNLINAFKVRLIKRLIRIFETYSIPFSKDVIEKLISDYYINKLRDTNAELSKCYKKMLLKYYSIISEYIHVNNGTKEEIKSVTSIFIKKLYSNDNPILNEKISVDFLENIRSKIYVYDNKDLNYDIDKRINEDTKDIIHELNKSNNMFLVEGIKTILVYCLKEK